MAIRPPPFFRTILSPETRFSFHFSFSILKNLQNKIPRCYQRFGSITGLVTILIIKLLERKNTNTVNFHFVFCFIFNYAKKKKSFFYFRRRARKQQHDPDEITPSKLSEEAFRLLRTVQSLLNTREPDLSSRLSGVCSSPQNPADVSSASSTVSAALDSDNSDHFQSQETLRNRTPIPPNQDKDMLQSAFGGECSPIPGLSAAHLRDATMSLGRRRRYRTAERNSFSEAKGSPPQLSISSADDESGFSSLNSFQEIGVPFSNTLPKTFGQDTNKKNSCQIIPEDHRGENGNLEEIGLPRYDENNCKIHRRWSSTPVDNQIGKLRSPSLCTNGDVIRVLWV